MAIKAIISLAGKQFFVTEGDTVRIDKHVEEQVGKKLDSDQVLLIVDGEKTTVGTPEVKGARVTLEVVSLKKGPKIVTARYQAKSRSRRTVGHRQPQSELKVVKIAVK